MILLHIFSWLCWASAKLIFKFAQIKSPQRANLGKLSHNAVVYQSLSDTPRVLVSFPILRSYSHTWLKFRRAKNYQWILCYQTMTHLTSVLCAWRRPVSILLWHALPEYLIWNNPKGMKNSTVYWYGVSKIGRLVDVSNRTDWTRIKGLCIYYKWSRIYI